MLAPARHRSTARSHVGLVRRINEDRVFDWSDGNVWAIADGMGGHRGGDVAAQSVVDALRALHAQRDHGSGAMLAALRRANDTIVARNIERGEQAGTTVVALTLDRTRVHLAWAGDSRCYRLRAGIATLLTHDHSVVQDLIDAGLLTPEAAARHPLANVVTRALGAAADCAIDTRMFDMMAGDRFLLCSDGLSRSFREADRFDGSLDDLADGLLERALQRDGDDNISFVLVSPTGGPVAA